MAKFMFFDFRCQTCQQVFEDFVKPDVNPPCPKCEGPSKRLVSAGQDPIMIDSDRWVKMTKQKSTQDKKFFDNHGVDKKHHSYGS